MGTSSGTYELNHECFNTIDLITRTRTPSVPIIYFRDKTRVHMFYSDSNTTGSLQCACTSFLESVCWHDVVWL